MIENYGESMLMTLKLGKGRFVNMFSLTTKQTGYWILDNFIAVWDLRCFYVSVVLLSCLCC